MSPRTWAIAVLVVLLGAGIAVMTTLHRSPANAGAVLPADPYATNLHIGNVTLSEATNGAGGKATYVDGTVENAGGKTLTAAVVQVSFHNTDGSTHRETLPLAVVRSREPYVDLQPISAAPVPPDGKRDFRLIFETVPESWDVQPPAIQVVHAEVK